MPARGPCQVLAPPGLTQAVLASYLRLRRRSPEALRLASILGPAALVLTALLIGAGEAGSRLIYPNVRGLDLAAARWLQSLESPGLTVAFLALSLLGLAPLATAQTAALAAWLSAARRPVLAWALLLTMAGELVLEHGTKLIVQRARPEDFRLAADLGYSFPSGHALFATCLYVFAAAALWSSWRDPGRRAVLAVAGAALPVGIGLSRIYLGVHYPSDVLAGWLGGLAWLATVRLTLAHVLRRRRLNPRAPRTAAESRSGRPGR